MAKPHTGPKALQLRERMRALESAGKLGPGNPALMQRLGKLRGSDLEAKMIAPEVAQYAGFNPKDPATKTTIERASPFTRSSPMIYPEQMRRLFGTLLTGDLETMAPWSDGSGGANANLTYPSWSLPTGLGTRPATPKLVDPAFGFNEQLYAMVWGTMLLPTGWSRTWIDDTRITALASEQVSWNALETYVFIDPATSIADKARTTGTEKLFGVDHEKSAGARMLEWANNLVYEAYLVEVDAQGYYRLNADGRPKLKLKDGKPQLNPDIPGGDAALKRYVANMEVMRQLVSKFVVPLESTLPIP